MTLHNHILVIDFLGQIMVLWDEEPSFEHSKKLPQPVKYDFLNISVPTRRQTI